MFTISSKLYRFGVIPFHVTTGSRYIHSVVCAVSGGVDSAVSAYLLKKKGFQVKGVFMTNWDVLDEKVDCSIDKDRQDAQPLIKSYEQGATPNPDILCNRFVKFNMFTKAVLKGGNHEDNDGGDGDSSSLKADAIATGHYCRNSFGTYLQHKRSDVEAQLLRSADPVKDQTFWLSTISHKELQHCMFPVGDLSKPQVKQIAQDIGLSRICSRRESMGMCFIGKRRFSDFIDNYLEPKPGVFKDLETNLVLDEHTGVHHFTQGQKARIKRFTGPYYVAKMDPQNQIIYVVRDPSHPSLFMRKCWCGPAVWINSYPFSSLNSKNIQFQWQNKWRPVNCVLKPFEDVSSAAAYIKQSIQREDHHCQIDNSAALTNIIDTSIEEGNRTTGPCLAVELTEPMRCIAPGQWSALYDGEVCLGAAMIYGSISLWEEGQTAMYKWNLSDYELTYAG
ncbi:unnamed protein product [Trichobilharzia szidati]|nr:unnamed protein product [Trichobilharzia szidati]